MIPAEVVTNVEERKSSSSVPLDRYKCLYCDGNNCEVCDYDYDGFIRSADTECLGISEERPD